jgi:hypothetical protein
MNAETDHCMRFSMAEREGFEPSKPVRAYRFSRPACSTTPAPLRAVAKAHPSEIGAGCQSAATTSTALPPVGVCVTAGLRPAFPTAEGLTSVVGSLVGSRPACSTNPAPLRAVGSANSSRSDSDKSPDRIPARLSVHEGGMSTSESVRRSRRALRWPRPTLRPDRLLDTGRL